jgi:hypothetical protein
MHPPAPAASISSSAKRNDPVTGRLEDLPKPGSHPPLPDRPALDLYEVARSSAAYEHGEPADMADSVSSGAQLLDADDLGVSCFRGHLTIIEARHLTSGPSTRHRR